MYLFRKKNTPQNGKRSPFEKSQTFLLPKTFIYSGLKSETLVQIHVWLLAMKKKKIFLDD